MAKTPIKSRRQTKSLLNKARWAGYAVAGAATALGAHEVAEAGIIHVKFEPAVDVDDEVEKVDVNGDFINELEFSHQRITTEFGTFGGAWAYGFGNRAQIAGFTSTGSLAYPFVSNLTPGMETQHLVSHAPNFHSGGTMAFSGSLQSQFTEIGPGYIGFRFDPGEIGGGYQYGWLRVEMKTGLPLNLFQLVEYAYAGVGEEIHVGEVPEPGSLGLLATGAVGLLLWRQSRRRGRKSVA